MHSACRLKRCHSWYKSWAVLDISGGLNFATVAVFTISVNSAFYFQSTFSLIACVLAWKRNSFWHHVRTNIPKMADNFKSVYSLCLVAWHTLWLTSTWEWKVNLLHFISHRVSIVSNVSNVCNCPESRVIVIMSVV